MNKTYLILTFLCLISSAIFAQNYRPKYHYTPPKNWVNDPNGLVYLDGEYHLFYQYNPLGNKWGHMSWGHAISRDLLKWQTLPLALPEFDNADGTKTMIFSGCIVVDSLNSSGFFKKGFKKGLIAIFTSHIEGKAQHQSLAYSSDKGRTWKYFDKNPVLDLEMKDFRDPNVIWYPERQVWIMSVVKPLEYTVQFYESKDMKKWALLSEFGKTGDLSKIWECPSLIKVPIENSDKSKWVLMVSCGHKEGDYPSMQYFVGDFDGKNFVSQSQTEPLYVDEGRDFYAAVPFFNLPKSQKNSIMIGWVNNWDYARDIPTVGYRGEFSVPRKLSVQLEQVGYRLSQKPILQRKSFQNTLSKTNFIINDTFTSNLQSNSCQLKTDIDLSHAEGFLIELTNLEGNKSIIKYNKNTNILTFDRTQSGLTNFHPKFSNIEKMFLKPINNHIQLELLIDNSIIEIFANGGKKTLTDLIFPNKKYNKIKIIPQSGSLLINEFNLAKF